MPPSRRADAQFFLGARESELCIKYRGLKRGLKDRAQLFRVESSDFRVLNQRGKKRGRKARARLMKTRMRIASEANIRVLSRRAAM